MSKKKAPLIPPMPEHDDAEFLEWFREYNHVFSERGFYRTKVLPRRIAVIKDSHIYVEASRLFANPPAVPRPVKAF